jgi:hypothetical protein
LVTPGHYRQQESNPSLLKTRRVPKSYIVTPSPTWPGSCNELFYHHVCIIRAPVLVLSSLSVLSDLAKPVPLKICQQPPSGRTTKQASYRQQLMVFTSILVVYPTLWSA